MGMGQREAREGILCYSILKEEEVGIEKGKKFVYEVRDDQVIEKRWSQEAFSYVLIMVVVLLRCEITCRLNNLNVYRYKNFVYIVFYKF